MHIRVTPFSSGETQPAAALCAGMSWWVWWRYWWGEKETIVGPDEIRSDASGD